MPRSESRSEDSANSGSVDDEVGHLAIGPGEIITAPTTSYEVLYEAGKGTFGRVLACVDKSTGTKVAVKVVRAIDRYIEAAGIESVLLHSICKADSKAEAPIVRFYGDFTFRGHMCLVFEQLGASLYDYVKANDYRPCPLYVVQAAADQLTGAVAFMHACGLVHTDLKLENVLFKETGSWRETEKLTGPRLPMTTLAPPSPSIKVIDFGGATYDWDWKPAVINTRQYRAPEVILGLPWSFASDVWSLGCILVELYTGELLFPTHDNSEHLALIEKTCGPIPLSMARADTHEARKYFHRSDGALRFHDAGGASNDSIAAVRRQLPLNRILHQSDTVFLDLLRGMLAIDPAARISAAQAFNHRFFTSVRGNKPPPAPAKSSDVLRPGTDLAHTTYYEAIGKGAVPPLSAEWRAAHEGRGRSRERSTGGGGGGAGSGAGSRGSGDAGTGAAATPSSSYRPRSRGRDDPRYSGSSRAGRPGGSGGGGPRHYPHYSPQAEGASAAAAGGAGASSSAAAGGASWLSRLGSTIERALGGGPGQAPPPSRRSRSREREAGQDRRAGSSRGRGRDYYDVDAGSRVSRGH